MAWPLNIDNLVHSSKAALAQNTFDYIPTFEDQVMLVFNLRCLHTDLVFYKEFNWKVLQMISLFIR